MGTPRGWARGALVGVLLTVTYCITPIGPAGATGTTDTATGALLGLWPGVNTFSASKNTPPDFDYLTDMNAWQGTPNSVINFYYSPSAEMFVSPVPTIWNTYHALPMLSLSTGSESFSAIVKGSYDPTLQKFATALYNWVTSNGTVDPADGKRMYIRLDWEANDNGTSWAARETSCTALLNAENEYRAGWQHIEQYVMAQSHLTSTNVAWVYSVDQGDVASATMKACKRTVTVGTTSAPIAEKAAAMYPGDAYVDWLGIDGYSPCAR